MFVLDRSPNPRPQIHRILICTGGSATHVYFKYYLGQENTVALSHQASCSRLELLTEEERAEIVAASLRK